MASAWVDEDGFACPVCLETLKDPATLPCGHSYCLACIQNHWDKGASTGQYSCPQCRHVFQPRPSLSKSTVLVEAMEKLRANSLKQGSIMPSSSTEPPSIPAYLEVLSGPESRRQGSVYPQLPSMDPRLCPQHYQPLDWFCQEEKQCMCKICCKGGHEGHRVVKTDDERKERQKEVVRMQTDIQKTIQKTEKQLNEIPHAARQYKALIQAVKKESTDLFCDLVKNVNDTGVEISALLHSHETALGSKVEGQVNNLEQEMAQLHCRAEELSRLVGMQDHVCFLKTFFTLDPTHQSLSKEESVLNQEETVIASIRSAIKELQESLEDVCKASLDKIATILNQEPSVLASNSEEAAEGTSSDDLHQAAKQNPGASAPPLPIPVNPPQASSAGYANPDPKTRDEMLKFRFEPTMDPNTVFRHVQLSDGGRKANLRPENLNPPEHPERFKFWRQVLGKEPLAGSPYYWEVEWIGRKVTIGVTYKDIKRKSSDNESRLGHNAYSWSLYWSGTGFSFWHDDKEKQLGSPKAHRIGVYLDQQVGVLAFYSIANNQATLIHLEQAEFNAPLYPGFRFWSRPGSVIAICQLD
ncbi:finTRIM family, member 86 [Gouania willdenowi]|uniref:Tripartite motif-containing protein 16-like n=1 Tax=Gouania willdenowi TaxID=441366 RepID=A0A8C5DME6_GOUWI|nr:tripartite motif-containing protein 16-like [Gouania willdenowi]